MSGVCGMSSSLYSSGETVIANPIESSSIFLIVVLLCACLEYLFTMAGDIKGKFFHQMFDTISEEILVVGVLSLLLSFGSSLPNSIPESWCIMMQWTHVCLLFMGVFIVLMLVSMVFVMFRRSASLRKFEMTRIGSKAYELTADEAKTKAVYQHFRLCCQVHGIVEDLDCTCFADYILRTEKQQLVTIGDLTWRSWLGLTIMVVINATRTRIPALVNSLGDYRDAADIGTYIAFMGMIPCAVFLVIHNTLDTRLQQFLDKRGVTTAVGNAVRGDSAALEDPLLPGSDGTTLRPSDLEDPRSFLLWQTPETTLAFLQMLFLALVWYGAVFCLNMLYITFTLPNIYLTVVFIVACFAPVVVLTVMLPATLHKVALLSSLGSCFNEARVRAMILVARGDVVGVDNAEPQIRAGAPVTEEMTNRDANTSGRVVAIKKPPPPLLIDDHSLFRLAATANTNSVGPTDRELLF